MNPAFEVLSQGDEIVTGKVVDTNAAWLSQQAYDLGFEVIRHVAVGDCLSRLATVLNEISQRADCCICTGGLGPTSDDLTAEAVAKAFDLSLIFDEIAYDNIQQYFSRRHRSMPESNRKQAMLPETAIRLNNAFGTAPGFSVVHNHCRFYFLPGVPSEMKNMFIQSVKPMLVQQYVLNKARLITLRTIGMGESDLQDRMKPATLPDKVRVGYLAEPGQVQVKLLFPNDVPFDQIDRISRSCADLIGDAVYSIEGLNGETGGLIDILDGLMQSHRYRMVLIETVSNGMLSASFNGKDWLESALIVNSMSKVNRFYKFDIIDNDFSTYLDKLAKVIQFEHKVDIVLFQYYQDKMKLGNLKDEHRVVLTALWANGRVIMLSRNLTGDAYRQQQQAVFSSMDLLRRYLQGKVVESFFDTKSQIL